MRFEQAITNGFRKYSEFTGRAGRVEFWWWILFTTLVSAAISAIPVVPMMVWNGTLHPSGSLAGLWSVAVLLPTLAVTVRRLRDSGRGWGNLFWILVPLAGLIVLVVLCAQPSVSAAFVHASESTPPAGSAKP